jgi:hypothetical protein
VVKQWDFPIFIFKKMSKNMEKKDSNEIVTKDKYIDWLEKAISSKEIKYFEYSDFKNIQLTGSGSFGNVVRANLKNSDDFFALKSFNNDKTTLRQVINEV